MRGGVGLLEALAVGIRSATGRSDGRELGRRYGSQMLKGRILGQGYKERTASKSVIAFLIGRSTKSWRICAYID